MNRTGSKILHGLLLATSGLVGSTVIASTAAMAGGPTGGHVAIGSATIVNASPTQTVINQSSKKALINWNSFSVSSGSSVQFNQPNTKSLTVNRITGADASVINGTLQANGNVWLLNANGVLFGKGSQVNAGSLLATTSDIGDDDFKNGNYTFKPSANSNASVVNKGTITVGHGGSVVLSAPQVSNEGIIQANLGTVVLGGAKAFTVDMTGDNLLTYQITAPVSDAPKSADGDVAKALVSNSGTIMAAGGHVLMTARAARNVEDNAINNTGMVEATTVSSHNGVIDLDAGPDGTVNDSGVLKATGTAQGQTGGSVNVTGGTVNIADGAKIDASGSAGGGTVQIGGGLHGQGALAHAQATTVGNATINADATNKGYGGTVAVWSDGNTNFAGNISARGGAQGGNGGQVETSGHTLGVAPSARVDTSAPLGLTGDWLLDPETITITANGQDPYDSTNTAVSIDPSAITGALNSTAVTLQATGGSASITVNDDIEYSSGNALSLLSQGIITVNANIQNSGSGAVNLVAGWDTTLLDFSGLSATSSAYGSANGNITINGSDIAVGSAGGKTLVAGYGVDVFATSGYSQIGYHGAGGGDIQVLAKDLLSVSGVAGDADTVAEIGNGGGGISGIVGGNIAINTLTTQLTGNGGVVAIGNIGGASSSQSGDIGITTGGLTLRADQQQQGQSASTVQIGNWSTTDSDGSAGGNITVTATGILEMDAYGDYSHVIIGNGGLFTNSDVSGDIYVSADSVYVNAIDNYNYAQARIGHRGYNSASGNISVTTTNANGTIALTANGTNLASIGQGVGIDTAHSTGNITVSSGGTLSLTGHDSGQARIGSGNAVNSVISVTAGKSLSMTVDGTPGVTDTPGLEGDGTPAPGLVWIGNFGNSAFPNIGGNITVSSISGSVTLQGQEDGSVVSIGNMGGATTTSGDVTVSALSGTVSLNASGETASANGTSYNTTVQIGNNTPSGSVSGNTTITASSLYIDATNENATAIVGLVGGNSASGNIGITASYDIEAQASGENSFIQIGNSAPGGALSGNIAIASQSFSADANANGTIVQIGNGSFYDQGYVGGNITGNIDITVPSQFDVKAQQSSALVQIGNGDPNSARFGDVSGDIRLNLDGSANFNDQNSGEFRLWNTASSGFSATGDLTIISAAELTGINILDAALSNENVFLGYTGEDETDLDDFSYSSAHTLTLASVGDIDIRGVVQNGGSGNIYVVAGWDGTTTALTELTSPSVYGGAYNQSYGGNITIAGDGNNASVGSAGGLVLIEGFNVSVNAGQGGGSAQIGYNGASTGNIVVNAQKDIMLYASYGDGCEDYCYAQIGNGGYEVSANASGNITVNAGDYVSLAGGDVETGYAQIGNGGYRFDGQLGGIISVQSGGDVTLTGNGGYAQIGNGGSSTTDDADGGITVSAVGDLTLTGGEGGSSQIGNGGSGFEGNVSGDIAITVGGTTSIDQSGWIGNYTEEGAASGDVSIVTGSGDLSGDFLDADLQNGNLLLGWTGGDIELNDLECGGSDYNSSHTFTILSTGNIDLLGNIQNSGTGAINLVAGWDGQTTNLSSLTNSGVYGNGGSTVTIGGPGPETSVAIGSKGGATNILTGDLLVSAKDGNAQLGYSGQGSGNINVYAIGNVTVQSVGDWVALIGNGDAAASGSIGGNINITTQSGAVTVESAADDSLAMIGNLGGAGSSQSGSTTINTHGGALTLVADNPGEQNIGYAHIGNLAFGSTTGTSSGNIVINAGAMAIEATGKASFADIGNGSFHAGLDTGALSGDININATTLSLVSDASGGTAQARIGHLGMGSVSGSINIATTGALSVVGNNGGLSSIGSVSAPQDSGNNPVQGAGSGNIAIQSGTVTLASQNNGYARIESGGFTSGNIAVAATGNISLTANGSYASIGALQSGNGTVNISVTSTGGGISLLASGTKGEAQIGNSANGAPGKLGGVLNVSAANTAQGNITVSASGNGSVALIGANGYGDTVTGDISVLAGNGLLISGGAALTATPGGGVTGTLAQIGDTNVSFWDATASGSYSGNVVITAQSVDGIGGSVFNDLVGGDVTVKSLGTGVLEIDDAHAYSSSHNLLLNAGGDLLLESSLQNSGSGNLTFVSAGNVTVGGAGASGNVSVGSRNGSTSITAKNLVVSAVHGNAQLGYAGAGTGAIKVNTTGNVTVQTVSNNTVALIGNGGYGLTGVLKGDISVIAGGNVTVQTNSSSSIADIGVIGGDGSSQSGNITISAGGQVGVIAQNATSSAQIGNQQAGATTPSQRGDASGNIAITSGSVLISATGTNTGAVIGMGNSLLRNQNASGSISVNTGNLTISSSSTTSTGTVALLGSRGYNSANSNIAVTASGNVSLVAGNYGNAILGQGSYGTAAGDIVVASGKALSLNASGASSQARVGNSGVNANGNITAAASGALTIAKTSGATALIGGSATGGTLTGNVTVFAGMAQGVGASIANDIVGGDFTLYTLNSGTLDVGSVGSYSSSHDLNILSADNLTVSGSIQNAGTGNITLAASHTLTVGGSSAPGGVAVGSKGGLTEIEATDLLLSATNGYAQIGYHGGGSGGIDVVALGNVTISGGGSTGYYAQIGDGGYGVTGSSSAPISVTATSNIALNGGAGQEAYAQIGNGGAESNSNSSGYSETGNVAVTNNGTMTLIAGSGKGSYVQIGHGGYLSGQSLNGTATVGGEISVTTYSALGLTGGGDDAYVQIGNGGDFLNKNVANGSNGTIFGNISVAVTAPNVPGQDQLKLTAGTGANSYTQIGNGGQGENTPVTGAKVSFAISGNVTIADLTLAGSNTGTNGYAQVGNGDASKTGTGNISGSTTLAQGTKLTVVPGKAPGSSAGFGNATGAGSVSGTIASSGVDSATQGSVASITQTSTNPALGFSFATVTESPAYLQQLASIDTIGSSKGPSPLEQLSDNSEKESVSDTIADSVGKSLGTEKTTNVSSRMLIPGLLKQIVTLTPNQPHGVPPADVDYSSWGNEALWRW